jgi:hypothetical protein
MPIPSDLIPILKKDFDSTPASKTPAPDNKPKPSSSSTTTLKPSQPSRSTSSSTNPATATTPASSGSLKPAQTKERATSEVAPQVSSIPSPAPESRPAVENQIISAATPNDVPKSDTIPAAPPSESGASEVSATTSTTEGSKISKFKFNATAMEFKPSFGTGGDSASPQIGSKTPVGANDKVPYSFFLFFMKSFDIFFCLM